MKKIYSLVMALCVALCASATPFQGLVKQDLKLHHSVAEFATGIQKAPAATQGLQYDAEAGSLTRYYNETDKLDVITEYVAEYGDLYVDVMAADKSDCLSLLLFVKSAEGGKIPAGTYPINNTKAEGTAYASEGYSQQYGVIPCAYYPLVTQDGQLYLTTPMYFMVSGNVVVEYVNDNLKLTINAVNSNNVPITIVYEVGGESGSVNPKLQYDEQTGSVNRTYTDKDKLIINDTNMSNKHLYVEIAAADNSDMVSLLFFVPAVDSVIGIPAGTYPIVAEPAMNTVLASEGVTAEGVLPSFYGTLVEQGGQLYVGKLWFLVSGQVVVENIKGKLKMTIDAVNSYDVPVKIVYNADKMVTLTYTSTDGNIVTPHDTSVFGANIVSNTYENGVGTITFDGPVTSIGDGAFAGCSSLTSITIPNGVMSIERETFRNCVSLTSITIPNSVTSIGDWVFQNCSGLTSITIPNSVTSIGDGAFLGCSSLTSITIPNSVTRIGDLAFDDCSGLTSPVYNAHCFAYMPSSYKGAYVILEGIKQIAGGAFAGCSSLTSITIPNSVMSIGDWVFQGCSSLTSITIPNSVTSIGYAAFAGCSGLTSIAIPNSVTSIGYFAFEDCSGLTSITIPNSVTSIGWAAFRRCSGLTSINVLAEVPPTLDSDVFYNVSKSIPVHVPCGTISAYQSAEGWKDFTNIQEPLAAIFSIAVDVNDSIMGTAKVDYNTYCEGAQISAIPNYGYHFAQWSDGNTDNPRTLVLTQDTTFTAYFAPNSCTITTKSDDATRGTTMGDTTALYMDKVTISATPNNGYRFTNWSDGNTDNPRVVQVTEDQTYTAYFAEDLHTVTVVANNSEAGIVNGSGTYNHGTYTEISATANNGYHFSHWNDGETTNPRVIQVTSDMTYTAYFYKNTYTVSVDYNSAYGTVAGPTSGEYLDEITLTATPNLGYNFVKWSDGVTTNPRTIVLTKDMTLSAHFAQAYSGQCGNDLYWKYDPDAQTIAITGSGEMYHYTASTQPWILFKEQIRKVEISNEATSLGTSAFEGCRSLGEVHIGLNLLDIYENAFAGCKRLYHIYSYPTYPPFADVTSFANYSADLHIPCEAKELYVRDEVWGLFNILCLGAETEDVPSGEVTTTTTSTSVTITWPTDENADSYTIEIKRGDQVFCTLTFSKEGQLTNIAFAPSRDGQSRAQYAELTANGLRFTVTNLNSGTQYSYDVTTKDENDEVIESYSGEFTTQSDVTTSVSDTHSQSANCQKILRNGQLIILRDGVEYNALGQEIQ